MRREIQKRRSCNYSYSNTLLCYGSETMDMDPTTIKGVWGLNATERPGAVYLASVLATHAQKGLPAFGIYGHDVVEADDSTIGDDIKEKLLRFGRAAVPVINDKPDYKFEIGKGVTLREGKDVTIIETGKLVANCLEEDEKLNSDDYQDEIVQGIADGLDQYFNIGGTED